MSTALLVPCGWRIASAGGGTVAGRQLIIFSDATLAASGTDSYTVTLVAPDDEGRALIGAGTASTTRDPNYRNNLTAAHVLIHGGR